MIDLFEREKLLRRVALKCADFARQLSYYHALKINAGDSSQNFWRYMNNNAIDLAILDWFHLFGYDNDDLHWKKVVADSKTFRWALLRSVGMSLADWKTYRQTIKDYRDKDIAHIEVRPESQVPEMEIALRATAYYYEVVFAELSTFRDYGHWPRNINEYFQRSLDQAKSIVSIAYTATLDIKESVY